MTFSRVHEWLTVIIMSPHHGRLWGGGGGGSGEGVTYCFFSVDPVSVGIASCLHSISLLNGQILAKLTQIYHWEREKC